MIILFIFAISFSKNIVIDNDLKDANSSVYQNLLTHISSRKDIDPLQKSLQEALLKRLIAMSQSHIPLSSNPTIKLLKITPTSMDDLRDLFNGIIEGIKYKKELKDKILKNQKKLEALQREINSIDHHHRNLITLKLQEAFIYRKLKRFKSQLKALEEAQKTVEDRVIKALSIIHFDRYKIVQDLNNTTLKLKSLKTGIDDMEMTKERLDILGYRGKEYKNTISNLKTIEKLYNKLLKRELDDIFLLYAEALSFKNKSAFKYQKEIIQNMYKMHYLEHTIKGVEELLLNLTRRELGVVTTLQSVADEEFQYSLHILWKKLNEPLFSIGNSNFSILKLIIATIIFITGYIVGWLYKRAINNIEAHNVTTATKTLLSNMGYYVIIIIAFFSTLKFLGISLTSIALVAGALSVGIGFGLQNIVSNFVSGIILMFERSIKIGDYIELSNGITGYVSDVKMRSVTITTNSNIDIIIPNQQLIENRVINWTMHDKIRRFEIPFGVAYGTPVDKVISTVLEAVGRSGFQDIYNTKEHQTQVIMTGMGDSSVNFKLLVWIKGQKTLWPLRTESRFLILIYNALNEADISIPFPQRDLHIKSIDTEIPVILKKEQDIEKDITK